VVCDRLFSRDNWAIEMCEIYLVTLNPANLVMVTLRLYKTSDR